MGRPSCEVTKPNIITGSTTWVDHLVKLANKTKNAEHSHKQVQYYEYEKCIHFVFLRHR